MTRSRLKKRGQTVYIMIGVLVLIALIFGGYIYSSRAGEKSAAQAGKVLEESVIPALNNYMKQSIEQAGIDVIKEIGVHGGTLEPSPFVFSGNTKVAFTCMIQNPGSACVNTMRTRQQIEAELAAKILANLDGIIDLSGFRQQGISIKEGEMRVDVIIGKTALLVVLHYPLELSVKNKTEKIEMFQSVIKLPLGILYDLSTHITNTETQEMEFDITEWNQKHPGLFITIDRQANAKDQIFQLVKDEYAYNFALEKEGFNKGDHGCCYNRYDFTCFKNVPKEQCGAIQGEYDPNPFCDCPAEGRLSCIISLPDAGCSEVLRLSAPEPLPESMMPTVQQPYTEVLRLSGYENAHASLPGTGGFRHSLCCNIISFYLTQEPDVVGTECTGNGAVFARLSSAENGHVDDPGDINSHFLNKVCISAQKNRISCMPREGICLGDEEPIISFTSGTNAHVGYSYRYNKKICCEAENIQ